MISFIKNIVDFILPQRCLICGKILHTKDCLCVDCFSKIHFITYPYCKKCGKPILGQSEALNNLYCADCLNHRQTFRLKRSAISYDDFSKKIILDFKFSDHIENSKLLAKWIFLAGNDIFEKGADLIIPVPLHFLRLLKRKYNQSALLALELSKLSGIPLNTNVLKKIKYTRPQTKCSAKERKSNIKNAFKVSRPDIIKDKHIILVDDVYTTGATMNECAKTLMKSGAKSVDILTVAMVCPE